MEGEKGFSLIETTAALAILGIAAVAFLGGVGTSLKAVSINEEQATAQSLIISEIEYVKRCAYEYSISEYPVAPYIDMPVGWSVPPPVVEPVHASDDGFQEVTVVAEHNGKGVLSLSFHKVDR